MKIGKGRHDESDDLLVVATAGIVIEHELKLDKLRDSVRALTPVLQKISEAMEAQDRANDSQTRANDTVLTLVEAVRNEISTLRAEVIELRNDVTNDITHLSGELARLKAHANEYDKAMAHSMERLTQAVAVLEERHRVVTNHASEEAARNALGWSDGKGHQ